jgi:hypothetical protein
MSTPRFTLLLTLVLLPILCVSCREQIPGSPSIVKPTDSPTSLLPTTLPTQSSTTIPEAKPTHKNGAPENKQANNASQNLSFEVPANPIDVILGHPTDSTITVSVLPYQDFESYIEYGLLPDNFSNQTPMRTLNANQPVEILLGGLQADASYAYRVRYRTSGEGDFSSTDSGFFCTQRASGSSFTFTIQADSHLDSNSNPLVYMQTLKNELSDQSDFVIDLGDTFMTDKYKPFTDAQAQYLAQRYYFSLIGQSAPIFLVLGNHDGEGAPKGLSTDISTWSAQLRTQYFPNPVPDGFYTGNTTPDKTVGAMQDYYAWEWGDALFIVLDPYWFTPPQRNSTTDQWNPTLGEEQYQWLKTTLETSSAQWKFVFIHQLIGGVDKNGRGGIEVANLYEWGGQNADGSWGFDKKRPGWELPIHQLFVQNHVTAVFHGHDHLFVKQELDGIIYQEVPQPSTARANGTNNAAEYGYLSGDILGSPGHLRVTVSPDLVSVDYVRSYLPQDEKTGVQNGQVDFSYSIAPK